MGTGVGVAIVVHFGRGTEAAVGDATTDMALVGLVLWETGLSKMGRSACNALRRTLPMSFASTASSLSCHKKTSAA